MIWKYKYEIKFLKKYINLTILQSYFLKWEKIPAVCQKCCISVQNNDLELHSLPWVEFLPKVDGICKEVKLLIILNAGCKIISFQLFDRMEYENIAKN